MSLCATHGHEKGGLCRISACGHSSMKVPNHAFACASLYMFAEQILRVLQDVYQLFLFRYMLEKIHGVQALHWFFLSMHFQVAAMEHGLAATCLVAVSSWCATSIQLRSMTPGIPTHNDKDGSM
jgi:hypothetical protein